MRALMIALAVLAIGTSRANSQEESDFYEPPIDIPKIVPDLATIRIVSAGEEIAISDRARSVSGAILNVDVRLPPKTKANVLLLKGEPLFRITSSKPFKACAVNPHLPSGPECLIDDDGDGTFDRGAKNYVSDGQLLLSPAPYLTMSGIIIKSPEPSFKRVLLYQGVNTNSLLLSYREFNVDMARPAFTQELSIPLSASYPQTVAAKGVVFTLIKIDGMGLTYKIDKFSGF